MLQSSQGMKALKTEGTSEADMVIITVYMVIIETAEYSPNTLASQAVRPKH